MRYFIITAFICVFMIVTQAQQNHYIYVQTENKQPFYIKLDNKIYTSAISGYLIVPKLNEGKYNIVIGFPKDIWPTQNIELEIVNNDQGFILKNFGAKGWGLFNLQSLNIVMATSTINDVTIINKNAVSDEFSTLLSNVVKDPSIKSSNQIDNPKSITKTPTHSTAIINNQPIKNIEGNQQASKEIQSEYIRKLSYEKSNNSLTILYLVKSNPYIDSVIVYIDDLTSNEIYQKANDSIPFSKSETLQIDSNKSTQINAVNYSKTPQSSTTNKQIINIDTTSIDNNVNANSQITNIQTIEFKQSISNSNCTNQASDEDFLKLRKKMAAEQNEESMFKLAKKYFKSKCFSTEQVKNLATLFLNDQAKYNFLDIAYPFVSDSSNFSSLQNLLTDEYFISRFKAMIRH